MIGRDIRDDMALKMNDPARKVVLCCTAKSPVSYDEKTQRRTKRVKEDTSDNP